MLRYTRTDFDPEMLLLILCAISAEFALEKCWAEAGKWILLDWCRPRRSTASGAVIGNEIVLPAVAEPSPQLNLATLSFTKKMQVVDDTTDNSEVILSHDTIKALQKFLARSRVIIPDLETPYSSFPNCHHSHISESEFGDQSTHVILPELQQQLRAVYQEIAGLDKVMGRLEDLRQQVSEKQARITQSIILHRGSTSALWRLPVEVLCQIFVHCLPETDHLRVSPGLAPLLLTRVCRRWKEVAVNLPRLWCTLSVTTRVHKSWEETSFWHHLWLKRAQEHPLSLQIRCSRDARTQLKSFLQLYNHQISSLRLILLDANAAPEHLFQDLPALQELTLEWPWGHDRAVVSTECISRLPCTLRILKLRRITVDPSTSFSTNVWAHLRNAEIHLKPHYFIHFLHLCPNLASLEIYMDSSTNLLHPLEPFTHTNLQSLTINCYRAAPLRDVFKALTLPNLRVLEAPHVGLPHEEVKAFLTRSNCPPERLMFGVRAGSIDGQRPE
ncbi:hypothetical protein AZE42_11745 [Rhizopogon vesiculosus]|uniref:F-box domain-containing protein n=1 Tax=Rhizopogon vesiculosus TaxID=180088 RepID=A0A1J8RC53_9AGAM|nr:hypothetical protein AZE42_11745 [Rhizopogon vesiculosus]